MSHKGIYIKWLDIILLEVVEYMQDIQLIILCFILNNSSAMFLLTFVTNKQNSSKKMMNN